MFPLRLYLFLIILPGPYPALSQQHAPAPWHTLPPAQQLHALNEEIRGLLATQPKLAMAYQERASALYAQTPDSVTIAESLHIGAYLQMSQEEMAFAERQLKQVIGIFKRQQDATGYYKSMINLAYTQVDQGKLRQAMQLYMQLLDRFKSTQEQDKLAFVLISMGHLYHRLQDEPQAQEYYQEALTLLQKSQDTVLLGRAWCELGISQLAQKQYDHALRSLSKAESIFAARNQHAWLGAAYSYKGQALYKSGAPPASALGYLQDALAIDRVGGKPKDLITGLNHLAEVHLATGQKAIAISQLQEAFTLAQQVPDSAYLQKTVTLLARYYAAAGNYPLAYRYSQHSLALQQWVSERLQNTKISDLSNSFELQRREEELAAATSRNALLARTHQAELRQAWVVGILLGLLVLICILLMNRYRLRAALQRQQLALQQTKQLELEHAHDQVQLRSLDLEEQVDHHTREHFSQVLHVQQQQELLEELRGRLSKLPGMLPEQQQKVSKEALQLINNQLQLTDNWEQMQAHFAAVHPGFFERLLAHNRQLSQNDLKLAAYTKMNLSSKEIAQMMRVSPKSVQVARYRLKKKLDLGSEVHLIEYLQQV